MQRVEFRTQPYTTQLYLHIKLFVYIICYFLQKFRKLEKCSFRDIFEMGGINRRHYQLTPPSESKSKTSNRFLRRSCSTAPDVDGPFLTSPIRYHCLHALLSLLSKWGHLTHIRQERCDKDDTNSTRCVLYTLTLALVFEFLGVSSLTSCLLFLLLTLATLVEVLDDDADEHIQNEESDQ